MLKFLCKKTKISFLRLRHVFHTHLAFKVWLKTTIPILTFLVCVIIILNGYLYTFFIDNAIKETQKETDSVASEFSNTYRDIIQRMISLIVSENFLNKSINCLSVDSLSSAQYTLANNDIQTELQEFIQMNGMIQSAVLVKIGKDDNQSLIFAPYVHSLNIPKTDYTLGFSLKQVSSISFLPVSSSPFLHQGDVLPLVIPLNIKSQQHVLTSDTIENANLILYILFDVKSVVNYLKLCCDEQYKGKLFLANLDGKILTESLNSNDDEIAFSQAVSKAILQQKINFQYNNEYVYLSPLHYGNLYIVNLVTDHQLLSDADNILTLLKILAITCLVMITIICVFISMKITCPLRILMNIVKQIETQSYDGKKLLNTKDELGQLENALNSMHRIIQHQVKAIQDGERQRYNAEMQMMTEQINPHFLYNTLEFINMEVYRNRPENASQMINNLGDYIRNSLSAGSNHHTIELELQHVSTYIDIMSCRFDKSIDVIINVPDYLRTKDILKSILQPLVENSLKYGFDINGQGVIVSPRIEITAECNENEFLLSVTDNGAGIDVSRAKRIMKTKCNINSKEQHVGLNNVYQRLQCFYGFVDITFSTIPYFKNTVMIHLPVCYFDDSGTLPPCSF